ncbi:hypothetical protein HCH_03349 [Hahella chejuensis KCTC 2396]|uniref:Uncharacterized protein n=1 Tax=Hahella chejuensis (strain KCTC 2396) TaxID=349521 RepID=Q2SGX1_HAHCH|nr:hypothetical protein HCH_03349 [Hahella chejuensis KCTC 2396]
MPFYALRQTFLSLVKDGVVRRIIEMYGLKPAL